MMPTPSSTIWYKTRLGKIFISILFFFFGGIVLFFGLTGYYTWQIREGKGGELEELFNNDFTLAGALGTTLFERVSDATIKDRVRPHNPRFGNKTAPVQVIIFIDFECPFCQRSFPITREVMDRFEPAIDIVFKHFPLNSIHPQAQKSSEASACAQEQGKFWEYYTELFERQELDDASLLRYAETLQLNTTQFEQCLTSDRYSAQITQDLEDGIALGVRGTPTYFINGKKLEGVHPLETWNTLILNAFQ
jgi:predicted DsbA family dithiol-disulfide isomerase